MAELIRAGVANNLDEAYDKACRLVPEVYEQLINERIAKETTTKRADQARRASKSLPTGVPSTARPSGNPNESIRGALLDAWEEAS